MAMRTISLCSGLGELCARELNKPGEGIRLRDGSVGGERLKCTGDCF